jgi:formate dehydrogenase iron-sulfur subunit
VLVSTVIKSQQSNCPAAVLTRFQTQYQQLYRRPRNSLRPVPAAHDIWGVRDPSFSVMASSKTIHAVHAPGSGAGIGIAHGGGVSAAAPNLLPDVSSDNGTTLIDQLLAEQRSLTAVERFSRVQARHKLTNNEARYRQLLPATAPAPGQQYAFEVNLDKCSGCKACVTACHSLNGLDETETWRSVGLLVSGPRTTHHAPQINLSAIGNRHSAIQQHVTTACHHCADPGCANGCPVLAYDKDPVTGIVRHLDDQCIGCSYCVMKCPYEVPKYSDRLGIVRKCDMCSQRLAVGEAPACVQACPDEAIKITLVNRDEMTASYRGNGSASFLPDAPDPRITVPTTRFISAKLPADLVAADHAAPRLDHAHWPLVIMLTLTQAAAGMFVAVSVASFAGVKTTALVIAAFVILSLGLTASILHLGQPLKAWRAFLGWRKSWLSREIIAFNGFASVALTAVVVDLGAPVLRRFGFASETLVFPCGALAATLGLGAVFTSAMVYVDTKRALWSPQFVFTNFFGTTLLLGATFAAVTFGLSGAAHRVTQAAAITALVIRVALFVWRRLHWRAASRNSDHPIHFNASTVRALIPWTMTARTVLFVGSTVFGLLALANVAGAMLMWACLAALTTFSSEIIVRYVFFAASASKRMPGGFAA